MNRIQILSIVAMSLCVSGCGGDSGAGGERLTVVPFGGKVYIDDKLQTSGTLTFIPMYDPTKQASSADRGKTVSGKVNEDGTFTPFTYVTGDGIIPGKYTVSFSQGKADDIMNTENMMAAAAGVAIEEFVIEVPDAGLPSVDLKFKSKSGGKTSGTPGAIGIGL